MSSRFDLTVFDREPWLMLRRVVWLLLAGIPLGLFFLVAAFLVGLTIIGLPIAWELLRLARFVFMPVGYQAIPAAGRGKNPLRNPKSPFAIIANILWDLFFGIPLAVLLFIVMIVQALTIIGIPNALEFPSLLRFVLWPVGHKIVNKKNYNRQMEAAQVGPSAVTGVTPAGTPVVSTPVVAPTPVVTQPVIGTTPLERV